MLSQAVAQKDVLEFADTFTPDNYKVLEIDEKLLDYFLAGNSLELRGDDDKDVFLVTDETSYLLRQALFTNTELLIKPEAKTSELDDDGDQVMANAKDESDGFLISQSQNMLISQSQNIKEDLHFKEKNGEKTRLIEGMLTCHYEAKPSPPRLHGLREILKQSKYAGEEYEHEIDEEGLFTWEELQGTIQASDKQIKIEMFEIHATHVHSYYRLLDEQYWWGVLTDIIHFALENDVSFDKVKGEDVRNAINEKPSVINHLLKYYSSSYEDDNYVLDQEKICLFIGIRCLHANPRMNAEEFFIEWMDNSPFSVQPSKELLRTGGHAIFMKGTSLVKPDKWIRYEEIDLPQDPKLRFEQLFEMKPQWKEDELKPFLTGLVRAGYDVDKLVLRNTRILEKKNKEGKKYKVFRPRHVRYSQKARNG